MWTQYPRRKFAARNVAMFNCRSFLLFFITYLSIYIGRKRLVFVAYISIFLRKYLNVARIL